MKNYRRAEGSDIRCDECYFSTIYHGHAGKYCRVAAIGSPKRIAIGNTCDNARLKSNYTPNTSIPHHGPKRDRRS